MVIRIYFIMKLKFICIFPERYVCIRYVHIGRIIHKHEISPYPPINWTVVTMNLI